MVKSLFKAIDNYISLLKIAGGVQDKEVSFLLSFLFIDSVLKTATLTSEERKKLWKALKKIASCSCLIPCPTECNEECNDEGKVDTNPKGDILGYKINDEDQKIRGFFYVEPFELASAQWSPTGEPEIIYKYKLENTEDYFYTISPQASKDDVLYSEFAVMEVYNGTAENKTQYLIQQYSDYEDNYIVA